MPRPTNTPKPTERPAYVPGIEPADVTVNVEKRFAMDCGGVQEQVFRGETYYSWYCWKTAGNAMSKVWVETQRLYTVDTIDASMLGASSNTAIAFLRFVASIPFIDKQADQQRAMSWVESTVPLLAGQGSSKTTTIGGVPMYLSGLPTAPRLIIGRNE
jgi:hypothetical protein